VNQLPARFPSLAYIALGAMAQLASTRGILIGYRRLYRYGLRAVHYSKPARFVLRDVLRRAFRTESALVYDEVKVQNTLQFFDLAAREQAIEHRILKNILHVRYWTLRNKRERKLLVIACLSLWPIH
jgi:hypothetical protein